MKRILQFIALAAAPLMADGAVVSPELAMERACAAAEGMRDMPALSPALSVLPEQSAQMRLTGSLSEGSEPTVYIFSAGDNGYLVASADDCAPALLGVVENGSYAPDNLPPSMKWYLQECSRQIAWARANGVSSAAPARVNHADYEAIPPMLATKWNQDAPYNDYCPSYGDRQCVTGCVATALAQTLAFHKYPDNGTGTVSYIWNSNELSYDYSNAGFDWGNMLDSYDDYATAEQKAAVANLMYACGVGVNMNYGTSESSASTADVVPLLIDHLGYRKDIHMADRNWYDILGWDELVYDQLRDFGPVQFAAQSNEGGHSFVCDGYLPGGYFHINWGWGGMSNGYFLLTALDPVSQGIGGSMSGFNFDAKIVANMAPDRDGTSEVYRMMICTGFSLSKSSCPLGSSVTINNMIYNDSPDNLSGTMAVKAESADGAVTYFKMRDFKDLPSNSGYTSSSFTVPSGTPSGTYTLTPVFKADGGEWTPMQVNMNYGAYITMVVSGNVAEFSAPSGASLDVSGMEADSEFFISKQFRINANVTNTGDCDYSGYVYGVIYSLEGIKIGASGKYPVYLGPGESVDMEYVSVFGVYRGQTLDAGDYYFEFVDSNGNPVSDSMQITIKEPVGSSYSFSNMTFIGDADNADSSDLNFKADVSCNSGYFVGSFTLVVFPMPEPGQTVSSVAQTTSQPLFIPEGETMEAKFRLDFASADAGKTYLAVPYLGGSEVPGNRVSFTVSQTVDTPVLGGESADVVATEVYNAAGLRVADNCDRLPAGVYVVRELYADGVVKSRKVFVR